MTPPGDVLDRIAAANPVEVSAIPRSGAPDAAALRARVVPPAPRSRGRAVSVTLTGAALAGAAVMFTMALPRGTDGPTGSPPPGPAVSPTTLGPTPSAKISPPPDAPAFDMEILRPGGGENALSGRRFTNASLLGRRTVIAFWASWCGPCRTDLPDLRRIAATAGPGTAVVIVASMDPPPDALAALDATGLPVALDRRGPALEAFGATGLPTTILTDTRGRVIWKVYGPGLEGIEATLQTTPRD